MILRIKCLSRQEYLSYFRKCAIRIALQYLAACTYYNFISVAWLDAISSINPIACSVSAPQKYDLEQFTAITYITAIAVVMGVK